MYGMWYWSRKISVKWKQLQLHQNQFWSCACMPRCWMTPVFVPFLPCFTCWLVCESVCVAVPLKTCKLKSAGQARNHWSNGSIGPFNVHSYCLSLLLPPPTTTAAAAAASDIIVVVDVLCWCCCYYYCCSIIVVGGVLLLLLLLLFYFYYNFYYYFCCCC